MYDNDAWIPSRALVPPGNSGVQIDGTDPQAAAVRSEPDGVVGVPAQSGSTSPIGPGTLLWSEAANSHWVAHADGKTLARRDAFGWTNAFALEANAPVHVHFDGNKSVSALRFVEIAVWIAAVALWFVTRRRRDEDAPDSSIPPAAESARHRPSPEPLVGSEVGA